MDGDGTRERGNCIRQRLFASVAINYHVTVDPEAPRATGRPRIGARVAGTMALENGTTDTRRRRGIKDTMI